MREAFKYLTSFLFLAVVAQVGLAGYGAFNALTRPTMARRHEEDDRARLRSARRRHSARSSWRDAPALDRGCRPVGSRRKVGRRLFGCSGSLQMLFAWLGTQWPALGFLHAVNALAIYAAAALLAHRRGRGDRPRRSRVASAPMGALRVAVVGSGPAGFYAAGAPWLPTSRSRST